MSVTYLLDTEISTETDLWTSSYTKYFVTSGLDGQVRVFDPATDKNQPVHVFKTYADDEPSSAIVSLDQPSDSSFFVTNSINSVLSKWTFDGRNTKLVARKQVSGGEAWQVSLFSNEQKQVVATAGNKAVIHVLSAADDTFGESLLKVQARGSYIMSVKFSPDGTQIGVGSSTGDITLIDANTGAITHSFPAHTSAIRALAFSPDSSILISGGDDKRVNLYDVRAHDGRRRFGGNVASIEAHSGWITALACRGDAKILASASTDGTIKMWDMSRHQYAQPLATLTAHPKDVWSLAWKPQAAPSGMEGIGAGAVQSSLVSVSKDVKLWRSQGST